MEENKVHVFEKAGLGKAPFRFTGVEERRGPIHLPDGTMVGSPGQPMGTCQYCGMGIAVCCHVESSDGKHFIVGSDCINKVGDAGLKRATKKEINLMKTIKRHEREDAFIKEGRALIESKRNLLYGHRFYPESPYPYTIMERYDWWMAHAGRSGKIKMISRIKKYLAEAGL